jgi:hypothetical protein
MALANWRGSVTVYNGAFNPIPVSSASDLTWDGLRQELCPDSGPQIIADKSAAKYITPGLLKVAPFVGRTLEKAILAGQPLHGVQRSTGHVTDSTFVLFDTDGISFEQARRINQRFKDAGVSLLAYTSHSFGRIDKPGVRARFALPVDRALDGAEYKMAWHGGNALLFEGSADTTGAKLSQQQGTWATSAERKQFARRWGTSAGVASADALIAASGNQQTRRPPTVAAVGAQTDWEWSAPSMAQIAAALAVFDPNDYQDWDSPLSLCVAISKGKGMDVEAMISAIEAFSSRGSDMSRAGNDKPQYSPRKRFETWQPSITPTVAAATLFGSARDRATAIYKKACASNSWRGTRPAWGYLAAYHPKRWNELRAAMEVDA